MPMELTPTPRSFVIGALSALLFTVPVTTLAQKPKDDDQKLVEQCRQQALQASKGEELRGKNLDATNASKYKPGKEYTLKINFIGHGNTYYNVTCPVDKQGNVTHEDTEVSGQPKT